MTEEGTTWNPEHLAVVKKGAEAIEVWRKANPQTLLQLSGASLEHAGLRGANLEDAGLTGAGLTAANLSNTNLRNADLSGANLNGASLIDANLSGANLSSANLIGANLHSADLSNTNLYQTRFAGAILLGATLVEANLRSAQFLYTVVDAGVASARNLDQVTHIGPSTLAAEALLRPTGKPWPVAFLRGVGLTNDEIEHALAIAASANAISFYSSFISYSTKDDAFAIKLHDALQAQGVRCWLDKHEILPGDNFSKKINEGIRLWDKVLLLCTKESLNSWWVKREVTRALEKEQRLEKERGHEVLAIIPLDIDGYLFTDECESNFEFAADLRKRHAARFKGWKRKEGLFDEQVEQVVKSLRADDGARQGPPKPKL